MFRDEYRKANDSIQAPGHLLESIKAEAEKPFATDTRSRAKWPSVLIYSGCAAAAAVLAILIFRPFSPAAGYTAQTAYAEVRGEQAPEEREEQVFLYSADSDIESPMLAAPAAGAPMETGDAVYAEAETAAFDLGDRMDGDEDEYYIFNNAGEVTYDTVFSMLTEEQGPEKATASRKSSITESASSDVWLEENTLHAYGASYDLPAGRNVRALIEAWDNIYVISEENGFVITSAYTENGFAGEVRQSGTYVSYEIKETTVFEDDYSLSDHQVVMVTSTYTPDLKGSDINDPGTFVPLFEDAAGERPLSPDEITCVNESSNYSVYGAVEVTDAVRMLYIFAELG